MKTTMSWKWAPSLCAGAVVFGLLFLGAAVGPTTEALLPAMFIFGDSFVDVGTNNYITNPLVPQCNIVPYGETFFHKPTGRWSNGRLITDFLAEHVFNVPFPNPYLKPLPSFDSLKFVRGVNFASGGSGILDGTFQSEGVINLSTQLKQFQNVKAVLISELGNVKATKIITSALFTISMGSNDYLDYLLNTTLQHQYSKEQYFELVISTLETDLQELLNSGARKILVIGLGPVGCFPLLLALTGSTGACVDSVNQVAITFNAALLSMVEAMNTALGRSAVVLGNPLDIVHNLVVNGASQGFTKRSKACCGGGAYNAIVHCGRNNYTKCANVNSYVFWDFVHQTERVYKLVANEFWNGNTTFIQPINVLQLLLAP